MSNHFHPSGEEAEYCNVLMMRLKNKEILDFKPWASVPLTVAGERWKIWQIDFIVYEKDGTISYHEVKPWSRPDDNFKKKRDAFLICYPNLKLFVNGKLYTGKPAPDFMRRHIQHEKIKTKQIARLRKIVRKNYLNQKARLKAWKRSKLTTSK